MSGGRRTELDSALEKAEELIAQKARLLGVGACLWPAPYNKPTYESRIAFLENCCFTWNEANGIVQQLPSKDYIRFFVWHWDWCKRFGQPLLVEKSRRLVLSWVARCLELHDAGLKPGNYYVSHNDFSDSAGMIWRIYFLYRELLTRFPSWHLDQPTTFGSLAAQKLDQYVLPNGSIFTATNSDSESVRGSGCTAICAEELSSYGELGNFFTQACLITQGSPNRVGGFVYALSNASPKDAWKELKKAKPEQPSPEEDAPPVPYGCEVIETDSGARLLRMHYHADPDKRSDDWLLANRRGDPKVWRREMELDDSVQDGEPVFSCFSDVRHAPAILRDAAIPVSPTSWFVGGWDCGTTVIPAFILLQILPPPIGQVHVLLEVVSKGNEPMERFAPRVLMQLQRLLPGRWADIDHVGDQTVNSHGGNVSLTAGDVARKFGISIHPISNQLAGRINAVTWLLTDDLEDQVPRFLISQKTAPMLFKGFQGAYKLDKFGEKPLKNEYSHIQDALQYAAIKTQKLLNRKSSSITKWS